jgi:hypothetical protein
MSNLQDIVGEMLTPDEPPKDTREATGAEVRPPGTGLVEQTLQGLLLQGGNSESF